MNPFRYSETEIQTVYRVIAERRDMRHFTDQAIDPEVFNRLLTAAHQAPSVGLMQPWRFIRITDRSLRGQIHTLVAEERLQTAKDLAERESEFLKLKVEGIMQCAEVIVAALCDHRENFIFGRRTLPEMDLASLSCAIQNLWLAARAEGLGMGWVSMFDPVRLGQLLAMPDTAKPVAILCLGHVEAFYPVPMLVQEKWATAHALSAVMTENCWDFAKE